MSLQESKSENIESKSIFELQNVLKEISQKNKYFLMRKENKVVKNSYDAEKMIKMIVAWIGRKSLMIKKLN